MCNRANAGSSRAVNSRYCGTNLNFVTAKTTNDVICGILNKTSKFNFRLFTGNYVFFKQIAPPRSPSESSRTTPPIQPRPRGESTPWQESHRGVFIKINIFYFPLRIISFFYFILGLCLEYTQVPC